jgi:hypothetical protein
MSNHPITPLASAQINHDHLNVELVEPDAMPPMVRIVCHYNQAWSIRSISPTWQPRSLNCSHGRISCSPA